MKFPLYQVDAFGDGLFSGNPACVCPLDTWLDDDILQKIAAENNVPETAFFVREGEGFKLRWFTPKTEIHLCGHATLASAHVLWEHMDLKDPIIHFDSMSGPLQVSRNSEKMVLDFPAQHMDHAEIDENVIKGIGVLPTEGYKTDYLFLVFNDEDQILNMEPDFEALAKAPWKGYLVTSRSKTVDFVYRFFAPKLGIPEDPATGSAQTLLLPYWTDRMAKTSFKSIQLSERRGYFESEIKGERILIGGTAVTYSEGFLNLQ